MSPGGEPPAQERANSVKRVDYDDVASTYELRYAFRNYEHTRQLLRRFVGDASTVMEVGCGTGHWLRELAGTVQTLIGLDRSSGMLARARQASAVDLVRGDALSLPFATASVDRLFCVNVLHHIADHATFLKECRRVIRPNGGFMTIALDPYDGRDRWWVYDYFPRALTLDRERYPAVSRIRELLTAAGFGDTSTEVAEHLTGAVPYAEAHARGSTDRRATSQLMVISDEEYADGMRRLGVDQPVLRTDLRLFATTAWVRA